MYINGIILLNNTSLHILFYMEITIKDRKLKNIEDGIKKVNKLYLQKCFDITHIHVYNSFETLQAEMDDLGISLNCVSKK